MKKIIYIAFMLMAVLSGCSKMLDDISPKNAIKGDRLNKADLGKLTNGVRYQMESLAKSIWTRGDWLAENYSSGPGFDVPDVHAETQATASATALSDWRNCFTKLNDVNQLLKSASGNDASSIEAAGNAYFFRAWIYYNLVVRYGGVPIITAPNMKVVPISKEELVWDLIISDCRSAIESLPEAKTMFYPTKDAARLLLARTLLWKGENSEAASLAGEVISSGRYSLEGDSIGFASMFINGTSSQEIVFALANIRSSSFNLLYDSVNDVDGSWNYSPAPKYYNGLFADNSLHSGDIRKVATFSPSNSTRVIKFPNGGSDQFIVNPKPANSPIVLFRLADAYLIQAEALGASAGIPVLKTFMEKRYSSVSLPASMDGKAWQDLILDENNREFYGEGRRWFDIKRTGRTDLYDSWNGRDFLLYWPIPQKERDIAGYDVYPQNPNYPD
ncbi:MAG: RagB/SusD family nutrient uptake outer membrane protein [Bacteroidales bacterium]|nr:RagB/SusD family nutrient uptake outer membrane protein [Bacteroidales bacterium]